MYSIPRAYIVLGILVFISFIVYMLCRSYSKSSQKDGFTAIDGNYNNGVDINNINTKRLRINGKTIEDIIDSKLNSVYGKLADIETRYDNLVSNGSFKNINVRTINGFGFGPSGGNYTKFVPIVQTDGVMEVGKYIDLHDNRSDKDYNTRILSLDNKLYSQESGEGVKLL